MNIAIYIVFALLLVVSSITLLLVLMQRPKQEGLGASFGAQMTDQVFGAQTSDVLKKGTVFFGSLFMILCFVLSVLMNNRFQASKSSLPTMSPAQIQAADAAAKAKEKAATDQLAKDMLSSEKAAPEVEAPASTPSTPTVMPEQKEEKPALAPTPATPTVMPELKEEKPAADPAPASPAA